ncbi:Oleosin domain-containing protein, partial [Cephalotus follicularis]
GPSASKILAVVTLLPVGGTLLCLAGLAFAGSLLGLLVTTPLFIICSPVLVPAAITIALAVAGFLASGAFGITALSSMSWMVNYLQRMGENLPLQVEHAKRRVQETTGQVGQKAREMGQTVHEKAKE